MTGRGGPSGYSCSTVSAPCSCRWSARPEIKKLMEPASRPPVCRLIRIDDRAQHNSALIRAVVSGAAVYRRLLVPHQDIADPPGVVVDETVLRRMLGQFLDQPPCLVLRHAFEPVGVQRVDKQDRASGHHVPDHRRPRLFRICPVKGLLWIAVVEPDPGGPVM